MKKNTIVNDTIRITIITLVAGLGLGLVSEITKAPIAEQEAKAKAEACQAVFADADDFTEVIDLSNIGAVLADAGLEGKVDVEEALIAKAGGEALGVVVTVCDHEGYGGDIRFTVGISNTDTINGISILKIGETPGLGMNATKPEFQGQFAGMAATGLLEYSKTGEEGKVDAISGATITTNAMTNGINAAIATYLSTK